LGRDGTNAFVRGLVGSNVKVERVAKVEDLLPLLQMQRADAVILPSRMFSEIKSTSSLVSRNESWRRRSVCPQSPVGIRWTIGRGPDRQARR